MEKSGIDPATGIAWKVTHGDPLVAERGTTTVTRREKAAVPPGSHLDRIVGSAAPGERVPFIPPPYYHGIGAMPEGHDSVEHEDTDYGRRPKAGTSCPRCTAEDELAKRDVATGRVSPIFIRNAIPGEWPKPKQQPVVKVEQEGINTSTSVWTGQDAGTARYEYTLVDFPKSDSSEQRYRRRPVWTDQPLSEGASAVVRFPS